MNSTDKNTILFTKSDGITVLSLFDGISCGKVALDRAGIKVKNYYASEIDEYAMQVSKNNHPNIIHLGDVNAWRNWNIDWSQIDLLIGGSPCQGFSFAGKLLNFNDERSKLFFVYVDILNHIKRVNPNVKFLLENVKMKADYQNVISGYLGVEPMRINSALVSAARRDRLYWVNFDVDMPEDRGITFDDINDNTTDWLSNTYIDKVSKWKAQQDPLKNVTYIGTKAKLPCLTARGYNQSHSGMILISDGTRYRYLTNNEAELAMTLPIDYTKGISDRERARCLGNGWTAEVIVHILKHLIK
ncbi:MAG: DNA cytosine methyltransferase [Clostridia bacterium]|nr:DNA cytosine methyltransferase [Clostridia bacterium]